MRLAIITLVLILLHETEVGGSHREEHEDRARWIGGNLGKLLGIKPTVETPTIPPTDDLVVIPEEKLLGVKVLATTTIKPTTKQIATTMATTTTVAEVKVQALAGAAVDSGTVPVTSKVTSLVVNDFVQKASSTTSKQSTQGTTETTTVTVVKQMPTTIATTTTVAEVKVQALAGAAVDSGTVPVTSKVTLVVNDVNDVVQEASSTTSKQSTQGTSETTTVTVIKQMPITIATTTKVADVMVQALVGAAVDSGNVPVTSMVKLVVNDVNDVVQETSSTTSEESTQETTESITETSTVTVVDEGTTTLDMTDGTTQGITVSSDLTTVASTTATADISTEDDTLGEPTPATTPMVPTVTSTTESPTGTPEFTTEDLTTADSGTTEQDTTSELTSTQGATEASITTSELTTTTSESEFEAIIFNDDLNIDETTSTVSSTSVTTPSAITTTSSYSGFESHLLSIRNAVAAAIIPVSLMTPFASVGNIIWSALIFFFPMLKLTDMSGWFFL